MTFVDTLRALKNRRYKSPDDLYRKRTRYGEINEFFKRQLINSDDQQYSPPFLSNPLRERDQLGMWQKSDHMFYEYLDDDRRAEAQRRFEFMYAMVADRIKPETKILDVGCNTGFSWSIGTRRASRTSMASTRPQPWLNTPARTGRI